MPLETSLHPGTYKSLLSEHNVDILATMTQRKCCLLQPVLSSSHFPQLPIFRSIITPVLYELVNRALAPRNALCDHTSFYVVTRHVSKACEHSLNFLGIQFRLRLRRHSSLIHFLLFNYLWLSWSRCSMRNRPRSTAAMSSFARRSLQWIRSPSHQSTQLKDFSWITLTKSQ